MAPLLYAASAMAQSNIGQWDFTSDLTSSAGGNLGDMTYVDGTSGATISNTVFGTTSALGIPKINGVDANVMQTDGHVYPEGYYMPTPPANGGGSLCNEYTYIVDYLTPTNGIFRPLLQMDSGTLDNITAYFAIGLDGSIQVTNTSGVNLASGFFGNVPPNTWTRIGFVFDHEFGKVSVYTNGSKAGSFTIPLGNNSLDGPYALYPGNLLSFSSPMTNTVGYVNSLQIRDVALNDGQMAALGGPSAAGIPITIPPVHTFIQARTPDVGANSVTPVPAIHVELNQGDTTLNTGNISLALDGTVIPAVQSSLGSGVTALDYTDTTILDPLSVHTLTLVYQDSFSGTSFVTNTWQFTVANYQNVFLPPTPVYSENFDEVAEGSLPAGWTATNATFIEPGHDTNDLNDPSSDSYLNWALISTNRYFTVFSDTDDYVSPGEPEVKGNRRQMIPPIVLNGVLLPALATGNLMVAESDQRSNLGQVNVLYTKDFDLTGVTNAYITWHMLDEQNQDNMCAVEYSIDQGQTWLPILYLLDDGTTDNDGSDVVYTNGVIDVSATFNTVRPDQAPASTNLVAGHTVPAAYGAFVAAPISTNLIPYIRGCRNDDPVQQKRIEIHRIAQADGKSHVRFRFMQAGTSSWYFSIDDLAIYSINTPVISVQPVSVTVNGNAPASFSVTASGSGTLSYQWYFNGQKINGATNAIYNIASATPATVGQYYVVVQNTDGPVKSSLANLNIYTTPTFTAQPVGEVVDVGGSVTLSASVNGALPLTYQWYQNNTAVPGANAPTLTFSSAQVTNSGTYRVHVSNSYSSVDSANANLNVWSGALSNSLVVHLTFDGNFTDTSGRTNNAAYAIYGTNAPAVPRFAQGKLGQAFEYTTTSDRSDVEYATLGYPTDLQFGDSTDFSVSFWANYTNQADDLAFIANKDWDSSSNPGWGIFTQGGGNFRINVTGPNQGSDKFSYTDTPSTLKDGNWHHIVVSFQRAPFGSSAYVYGYLDGKLVNKHPMNTAGTIDTLLLPFANHQGVPVGSPGYTNLTWGVNIGQDGTGLYTDNGSAHDINALIDDFGIWRRALTANEVAGIYNAGQAGKDLSLAVTPSILHLGVVGQTVTITWAANPALELYSSPTLNPATWTAVPGTLGASSATLPLAHAGAFFKLSTVP